MTTQPRRPGRPAAVSPTIAVATRRGVGRSELARLLGVPPTTVDAWRRAGCPRLADARYRPASVLAWLRRRDAARADDRNASRQRGHWAELAAKALALGRLHSLAERRAQFMKRDDLSTAWRQRVEFFADRCRELPRILAARCASSPADVVEREAATVMREMLAQFARRAEPTPSGADAAAPDMHQPHDGTSLPAVGALRSEDKCTGSTT